ncbi:MAG TPA: histidine phosphatase family protein [Bryobacteraceae bacterium]|nr:histidine phosphatase family protein [Bryobacteraceae bacterium]
MALLTLIRHGQASFLEHNYDKLSKLGEEQSRILGEYWLKTGATFDQIYYGPACRHRRTGDIVAEVFRRAGRAWPEPLTLPELDEYPGIEVMRTFLPGLMETHEDIRALEAEFRQAGEKSLAFRVYDKLFQRITRMWVDEELDSPEVESWKSFCERVTRGMAEIREQATKNARIAVFTSGGVIGGTVRLALDLGPQRTLEVSWASRNASYTEFLFSTERFSLSSFNNHPHLDDPDLITYR